MFLPWSCSISSILDHFIYEAFTDTAGRFRLDIHWPTCLSFCIHQQFVALVRVLWEVQSWEQRMRGECARLWGDELNEGRKESKVGQWSSNLSRQSCGPGINRYSLVKNLEVSLTGCDRRRQWRESFPLHQYDPRVTLCRQIDHSQALVRSETHVGRVLVPPRKPDGRQKPIYSSQAKQKLSLSGTCP